LVTTEINEILERHPETGRDTLIPILQEVQAACGYVPKDAVIRIGRHLGLPASKIYGVATFYNQFRFAPPGRFHVQVCRGTACHVKGSSQLLEVVQRGLKITAGQTTRDGLFSLEVVACIGACGLAPVICVNGEFYARATPEGVKGILDEYRKKATSGQAE
jgi:NADH-quinone oxidoreductase subunit E